MAINHYGYDEIERIKYEQMNAMARRQERELSLSRGEVARQEARLLQQKHNQHEAAKNKLLLLL